jgi:hypothetical protein
MLVIGLAVSLAVSGLASSASADSLSSGGDVSIAQSLGDRELTVVIRRVTSVPGPLQVDLVTHVGSTAGSIALSVVPIGTGTERAAVAPGAATDTSSIELGSTPGAFGTSVDIDRAGPWELVLDDGAMVARIPFVVPVHNPPPAELVVYIGFVVAGGSLLAAVGVALWSKRGRVVMIPIAVTIASLSVSVTGAALSAVTPLPPTPGVSIGATTDNVHDPYATSGAAVSDFSRPPLNLVLEGSPTAERPGILTFRFLDGASGSSADDLMVHDGAMVHLLMIGPTGDLVHLHPVRTEAGTYQVQVRLPTAGVYAVSAEIARLGGGVQQVRSPVGLDVAPSASTEAGAPVDPGAAVEPLALSESSPSGAVSIDGNDIDITAFGLTAGSVGSLDVTTGGENDLQLWLGMLGHLIVAVPVHGDARDVAAAVLAAPIWSHGHSMGAMEPMGSVGCVSACDSSPPPGGHDHGPVVPDATEGHASDGHAAGMVMPPTNGDSPPDETVAAFGPVIPYTFSFGEPGLYLLWVQFERDYTVVTVPLQVQISENGGGEQ